MWFLEKKGRERGESPENPHRKKFNTKEFPNLLGRTNAGGKKQVDLWEDYNLRTSPPLGAQREKGKTSCLEEREKVATQKRQQPQTHTSKLWKQKEVKKKKKEGKF